MGRESWRALGWGKAAPRCGNGGFGEGAGRDPSFSVSPVLPLSVGWMDSKAF